MTFVFVAVVRRKRRTAPETGAVLNTDRIVQWVIQFIIVQSVIPERIMISVGMMEVPLIVPSTSTV